MDKISIWLQYGQHTTRGLHAVCEKFLCGLPGSQGGKIWMNITCTLLELWVRPTTKIATLFWPAVVKRLPTTDIDLLYQSDLLILDHEVDSSLARFSACILYNIFTSFFAFLPL